MFGKAFVFAAFTAGIVAAVSPASANQIVNGGFEASNDPVATRRAGSISVTLTV